MNKFFVLHGHFYQPPREDPWWQDVPRQESAHPHHNWNERIYWECYLPNASARVFDEEGKIIDIVNNYTYINFNFGPTLLLWLRQHHPEFISYLKQADLESSKMNQGDGNAIAQAYNHMILPLANDYDKDVQVYWGKTFFQHIFEREPQGMWLPETACNLESLRFLRKYNIKYVILSPQQAQRVRRLGDKHWEDVSDGSIDVQRTYRIFLDSRKKDYIDCFFYQGSLSHAISFQQLMQSAPSCADRIIASYSGGENSLVSIATDGETFGHHHPFSEMCLAYLMKYELPERGIKVTNFSHFLSKFPPQYEVEIKPGSEGLGTSWSCAHGVKRWQDDCGCRIGFYPNWNQKWRRPLRGALDWLRRELDEIFLKYGNEIFHSPWQARKEFIQVISEPCEENVKKFYRQQAKVDDSLLVQGMKLLEMQHMGMLFYTSCAWFFDEISGIEAVQNLKYAARAIQLAKEISGEDLEEAFLNKLSYAKSNIPKFGDGRGVYEILVRPNIAEWNDYLSSYLIYNAFFEDVRKFYKFEIEKVEEHRIVKGEQEVDIGRIRAKDRVSLEVKEKLYLLRKQKPEGVECYLNEIDQEKFNQLKELFEGEVWISDRNKLAEVIHKFFFPQPYLIKDIHFQEQEEIVRLIFLQRKESIFEALNTIWESHLPLLEEYKNLGLRLPYEMHLLGASILNYRIKEVLQKFRERKDLRLMEQVRDFIAQADKMRLELDLGEIKKMACEIAEELINEILHNPQDSEIEILIRFHQEISNLNIDYYTYLVQNIIACLLQNVELTPALERLAQVYSFNSEKFLEVKRASGRA